MLTMLSTLNTQAISNSIAASLNFILGTAQLSVKANTFAGSPPAPEVSKDWIHVGLVGLSWNSEQDILGLDVKELYFGKAKRGVLTELVSGTVTSRLKLDLHDLCLENLGWDDPIAETTWRSGC